MDKTQIQEKVCSVLAEHFDKLIKRASNVVTVALDRFYLSPCCREAEHGKEIVPPGRAFQLRHRGRAQMSVGEDAHDAIDLSVAPHHTRNEPGQDDEALTEPEPAGVSKVVQGGLHHDRRSAESVPQSLQRHARITGVLPVILSK